MTAPNSLIPLPNIRTKPVIMLLHAIGSEMVKNVLNGDAPRLLAAFSRFTGTARNPSREALIIKGTLTKAMARAIPSGCPTMSKPMEEASFPINVSLETTPSKAIPAAECGITMGRSIIPEMIFLPGKFFLASKYAKGTARSEKNNVAPKDIPNVNPMLSETSFSDIVSNNRGREDFSIRPRIGPMINNTNKPPASIRNKLNQLCAAFFNRS